MTETTEYAGLLGGHLLDVRGVAQGSISIEVAGELSGDAVRLVSRARREFVDQAYSGIEPSSNADSRFVISANADDELAYGLALSPSLTTVGE